MTVRLWKILPIPDLFIPEVIVYSCCNSLFKNIRGLRWHLLRQYRYFQRMLGLDSYHKERHSKFISGWLVARFPAVTDCHSHPHLTTSHGSSEGCHCMVCVIIPAAASVRKAAARENTIRSTIRSATQWTNQSLSSRKLTKTRRSLKRTSGPFLVDLEICHHDRKAIASI